MADYISRETAIAVAEDSQKKVCPRGLWGRAFALDKEQYDLWQNLIERLEAIPAADVEPVVRADWQFLSGSPGTVRCSNCGAEFEENPYAQYRGKWIGCPACRAKMQMIMDLEAENDG